MPVKLFICLLYFSKKSVLEQINSDQIRSENCGMAVDKNFESPNTTGSNTQTSLQ